MSSLVPMPVSPAAAAEAWPALPPRALHPSTGPLDVALLLQVARRLGRVVQSWARRADEHLLDRQFETLLATEAFEAWVIDWPPGTVLDLHDHGRSAAAFFVVAGALDEVSVTAGVAAERRLRRGAGATVVPGQVHAVGNRSRGAATSVHVYSPRLTVMTYYELGDGGRLTVTRDDRLPSVERSVAAR